MPHQTFSKPQGLTLQQHLLCFFILQFYHTKNDAGVSCRKGFCFFPLTPPLLIPHKAVISSMLNSLLSASALPDRWPAVSAHNLAFYLGNKSGGRMLTGLHMALVTCRFQAAGPRLVFTPPSVTHKQPPPPCTTIGSQSHKNNFVVILTSLSSQQRNSSISLAKWK